MGCCFDCPICGFWRDIFFRVLPKKTKKTGTEIGGIRHEASRSPRASWLRAAFAADACPKTGLVAKNPWGVCGKRGGFLVAGAKV